MRSSLTGLPLREDERILLCVDLSYQVYRAAAAHPMLTSRRVFTGGLYGFMTTLAKIVRETKATHIAFCQDRKPYLRSLMYPEYKQLRKQRADEELLKMHKQSMKLVLECLNFIGLEPWGVDGFESDDLVGHAVFKYRNRFDRIYAASNDSDLFQLFWARNFYVYSKNIVELANGASLMEKTGLTPEQFRLATALMGSHNDVAGIPKVGEKTSIKWVKDPVLLRSAMDKHKELIERNLSLMVLPHPKFPKETPLPTWRKPFNARDLYICLSKYDIDVTNSMVRAFEQVK